MAKIQTSARTVDMLGRQQIAGIQNALSELFKNAHDAYARHAIVDYFEDTSPDQNSVIVIRDDGVGMTREDFEQKWLVLGTDSKSLRNRKKLYKPPDMAERPVTGEKGIGRLSIALLGRQVLVLTRARREDGLQPLVMAFVHWGLFEIPGVNLEEIEIPVETFEGGLLPTVANVEQLKSKLKECVIRVSGDHDVDLQDILNDLDQFVPDPSYFDDFFAARDTLPLSLTGEGTGTHFLIGPGNPVIKIEIDYENRSDDYSFRKQLIGFCDQTFARPPPPIIATSFRYWRPGDLVGDDLLDPSNFFNADDLTNKSDHLLDGDVDEFGQFRGMLRVYEKEYSSLQIAWSESHGKRTKCGPFKVTFGYLMGRNNESIVPDSEFAVMNQKLDYLGGLYVYRDGVRILPYGDHSYDWLEVEKRRNKGAGHYFFSFRRMFGAVTLTREQNGELQEKAGREGFQQNEAYRQLRDILVNLLIQLAAEFFRKSGTHGAAFEAVQEEIRKRAAALEKQQKQAGTKRRQFAERLSAFDTQLSTGLPQANIANLRKLTQSRMDSASKVPDQDKAAAALIRAEQEALLKLSELRKGLTVKRPAGVGLTKSLTRDWESYLSQKERLESGLLVPFEQEIANTLGQVAKQARIYVDQRKRLDEILKGLAIERKKDLETASRELNQTAADTRQAVLNVTERARTALDQAARSILADLHSTDLSLLSPEKIEEMRRNWETQLFDLEARHRDALMAARDMLASLAENLRNSEVEEPAQVLEALEERMLALEEQSDSDFEMVQLGLAVAIINHEFAASIKRVRKSIRDLGQISMKAEGLRPLYDSIRSNFEHLDGHLNLFTPLQRRLNRVAVKITGKDIRNYVMDVFSGRFERHEILLDATESFFACSVECFPSTLYPAFINLIDNAVFWLSSQTGEKIIRLDATEGQMLIANNGAPIEERDWERIFERGYSRKPSGRGLGLFISARALAAENMALTVSTPPPGFNAAFKISMPTLSLQS